MDEKQQLAAAFIKSGHNIVISGGPGTGKSTLIKKIVRDLKDNGKHVCLTGSTGMAAINIAVPGVYTSTVHSFAGLMDGRYTNKYLESHVLTDEAWESCRSTIRNCDILFVDEASMLSARTFEQVYFITRCYIFSNH